MAITLVEFVILGFAVWSIIEIWHHGSIFAAWRARVQLRTNFVTQLLQCPFCLSVWVAGFVVFLWFGYWSEPVQLLFRGIVTLFAVARLANVCNDLSHKWCRTPKDDFSGDERDDRIEESTTREHDSHF